MESQKGFAFQTTPTGDRIPFTLLFLVLTPPVKRPPVRSNPVMKLKFREATKARRRRQVASQCHLRAANNDGERRGMPAREGGAAPRSGGVPQPETMGGAN